jgi:uncharacterized repeat protein (TIGR02543 family)
MKANTPAPGPFVVRPTDLYNAGNAYTAVTAPTANSQMAEGLYSAKVSYVRNASAGGATVQSTTRTNVYVDTFTIPPTLTTPAASTRYASPLSISYALPEQYLAGSAKLKFVQGGTTINTLTLVNNTQNASFTISTTNISSAYVASATSSAVADGTYDVVLEYQDRFSHAVASATSVNVQIVNAIYSVTYDANGSTSGSVPTDSATYGSMESATVLANTGTLAKTGYTFAGWNTQANGGGTVYAPGASIPSFAASVVLFAQWTLIPTYSVTYNGNTNTGGSVPTDAGAYANGATVTVLGNTGALVKTGYTFNGWNTAANGSGAAQTAASTFAMGSAAVTLYAQWTTAAVNGACATIAATAFTPITGLCTTGTAPGAATPGSPWTWSCTGAGGGSTALCSAPNASTATGSGTGRASISGGTWVVDAANSGFVATSTVPSLPPGYTFPHGLMNLKLTGGVAGSTASVVITYSSALPAGTVYWKYGRTAGNTTAHWYQFAGAAIAGNTITLTLTDGADGDDDMIANGTITDPGGPGVPGGAGGTGVPTLSEWGVILLSGLMAMFGLWQVRRREVTIAH